MRKNRCRCLEIRIILDTNIVVGIFDGDKDLADKIDVLPGFSISSIVLGELYVGVNRVKNKAKHLKKLSDFLLLCSVMYVDDETAKYYGEIVADLFKKGRPIPTNDIWIAAIAQQHQLTLVSRDRHFKEIDDLNWTEW